MTLKIEIQRIEGEAGSNFAPVTVSTFTEATKLLSNWSMSAPKDGSYHKCEIAITFTGEDGEMTLPTVRYCLQHYEANRPDLKQYLIGLLNFWLGTSAAAQANKEKHAALMKMLRVTEEDKNEMSRWLDLLEGVE